MGVVKSSLKKTLHLSAVSDDELRTILVELEGIMNQRPLTYVSDIENSSEALTPSHFLSSSVSLVEPWVGESGRKLRGAYGSWVAVSNKLIDRWKKEYLTSLRVWRGVRSGGKIPEVGDVVLVKEGSRRSQWPLALVEQVLSPFVVKIKLNGKITRRATNLLFPLEAEPPWEGLPSLSCTNENLEPDPSISEIDPIDEVNDIPVVRDRRGRAIKIPARYRD